MTTQSVTSANRPDHDVTTNGPQPILGSGTEAPKAKGNRPSHVITLITKDDGGVKTFKAVGAMWPHKAGQGFSIKLSEPIAPGMDLWIRAPK